MVNRFFEQNPSNRVDAVALLSRPGSTFFLGCGNAGPIRANFTQDGTFAGDLFTVSGSKLFEFDRTTKARTAIGGTIGGGTPVMAGTSQYLFICDGQSLQYLDAAGSHAQGTLTVSAAAQPGDTNTVVINGQTYTFKTVLTPVAGEVIIGADAAGSLQNLADAINKDTATSGISYAAATPKNAYVDQTHISATALVVTAILGGAGGNAYTTTETITGWAWGGATLAGGAANTLSGITTPDDVGIVSICVLNSYVLCATANGERIYFIRPGEVTIDPLDFFAAEAQPDQIISLLTVGDQFWALGSQTTQVFYATGDTDAPFAPVGGRAFSQGTLEGTAVLVNQQVIVAGNDNIVYIIAGGPRPISDQGISERIRKAYAAMRDA